MFLPLHNKFYVFEERMESPLRLHLRFATQFFIEHVQYHLIWTELLKLLFLTKTVHTAFVW